MKTSIAIALFLIGIDLLVGGFPAPAGRAADAVRTISGNPADRTIRPILSGIGGRAIGGTGQCDRCQRPVAMDQSQPTTETHNPQPLNHHD